MSETTAVGPLSKSVDALRTTFADSARFRTWVGAADQAEALERVHRFAIPPPRIGSEHSIDELRAARPYAAVWTSPEDGAFGMDHSSSGDSFQYQHAGQLAARLVWDVPAEIADNPAEIFVRFNNELGVILTEMGDLAADGSGTHLAFSSVRTTEGPARVHPKLVPRLGDFVEVDLLFLWRT